MDSDRQCEFEPQLLKVLAGDALKKEQEALFSHLATCSTCRQRFDELIGKDVFSRSEIKAAIDEDSAQEDELVRLVERLRSTNQGETDVPAGTVADDRDAMDIGKIEVSLDFLSPAEDSNSLGSFGGYEVLSVIGCGAMGIVLKTHDRELDRIVAVKVLRPELAANGLAQRRFVSEARKAAAITHDHVVTIHGVGESNGLPYIVMGYVVGTTLQERIQQTGPLKINDILRIGAQTAQGLAAAHAQGLIHRDIKPANILLENGVERVKIADFGLARAMDDMRMTQTGGIAGTPEYMAPEQTSGEADERSDLFSLGAVMYAMSTGRSPFRANSVVQAIRRVNEDNPRPIREVNQDCPDWLCEVVERLLEKNPDDRFQSASEVADLLQQSLADRQRPAGLKPRPRKGRRSSSSTGRSPVQHKVVWGVATVLLLAGAVLLGNHLLRSDPNGTDPKPVRPPEEYVRLIAIERDAEERTNLIRDAQKNHGRDPVYWWRLADRMAMEHGDETLALAAGDVAADLGPVLFGKQRRSCGIRHRELARYRIAHRFYDESRKDTIQLNDLWEAGWSTAQLARMYGDFHNLEMAERYIRDALAISRRRKPIDQVMDVHFQWELANVLAAAARQDEAAEIYRSIVKELESAWEAKKSIFGAGFDREIHDQSLLQSGGHAAAQEIIARHSGAVQRNDVGSAAVLGLAFERQSEVEQAIENYSFVVQDRKLGNEGLYQAWAEERLLRLLLDNNQADRAIAFFDKLVTKRDEFLPEAHPGRAFTRILLAEALDNQVVDRVKMRTALDEAEQILKRHEFTPDSAYLRIHELRVKRAEGPSKHVEDHLKDIANCNDQEKRQALIENVVDIYGRRIDYWQRLLERMIKNREYEECLATAAYDVCKYAGTYVPMDQRFGESCRARGFYRLSQQVFNDQYRSYISEEKLVEAGWIQFRLTRLYGELHDYEQAERCARDAMQRSQEAVSSTVLARSSFQTGLVLALGQIGGREDEYQPLALKVARDVERNWEMERAPRKESEEAFHDELLLLSETDVDAQAIVHRFSDVMKRDDPSPAYVAGLAYERLGDVDRAIDHYEYAARRRDFNTWSGSGFGQRVEERMLRLLLERGEAARAEAIFEDLVADRDKALKDPRAVKAFTRLRLAEVILEQRKDSAKVNRLLDEAEEILRIHDLTPARVFEWIARLRTAAAD